jgi:DNA-binding NarL/FixJ family response regulator
MLRNGLLEADEISNREIAREIRLSEQTVKNYLYRIFNKLVYGIG